MAPVAGSTPLAEPVHPASTPATTDGTILELYPNPTTEQNHGEYVLVELDTPGEWTLTDGQQTAELPEGPGTYAVSRHPNNTAAHTNEQIIETESHLRLAVSGDRLKLKRDGQAVDTVSYDHAPESHRWHHDREPNWQPDGFEPREPKTVEDKPLEAFVLPDATEPTLETLAEADDRLYLAAYTLESERVVEKLITADEQGVDVAVLVEGGPVGGVSTNQAANLEKLTEAGISPQVMTGEQTRFRYHHPKYAVVDNRAVVLTENWNPSGIEGAENRGWGVVVESSKAADEVAAVFEHDASWDDTADWADAREEIDTHEYESASGEFDQHHAPKTTTAEQLTILTAPDNALEELERKIDAADDRLVVVQPRISDTDFRLLQAAIRAADRGVEVRILLGSQWYDEADNEQLATELRAQAEATNSSLAVRLAEDTDRFGTIHSKGIVVDDTAVVGSLNWNNNSAKNNRELAVALEDPAVADYYTEVFDGDWEADEMQDDDDEIPVGVVLVSVAAAAGTVLVLKRRLEFAEAASQQQSLFKRGSRRECFIKVSFGHFLD